MKFKKILVVIFSGVPAALFFVSVSWAETKTFTHTVKQPFGGSQSPDDARIGAMVKAKREVLEKAGTYLQSLTVVKNNMVESDEIAFCYQRNLKTQPGCGKQERGCGLNSFIRKEVLCANQPY